MFRRRARIGSKDRVCALVLPLVLLVSPVFSGMLLYVCSVDGQARLSCCCPQTHRSSAAVSIKATSKSCCELHSVGRAAAGISSAVARGSDAPLTLATTAVDHEPRVAPATAAVAWHGPPHDNPAPLFVRHCSFLI